MRDFGVKCDRYVFMKYTLSEFTHNKSLRFLLLLYFNSCTMRKGSCCMYATGIISAHLVIVGIALFVAGVFQTMIHNKIKGEITLTEGSKVFATWKNPPPPVFMEFFFFNVTNPEAFLKGEAKPHVTEMGPYTYREYRPKHNVTFVDNGTKVAAYTPKSFVFVPEKSVGDPSVDLVTTVNIPAVAVMNKIKGAGFWVSSGFSMFMNSIGTTMFMTRTVNDLLWGFKDPLLTRLRSVKPEVEEYFGLMYNKNGSNDGEFVYHTGEHNYLDFGRIYTWKGQKLMSFWKTNQSNMINGSDGSAFHPFLSKEERLNVFTPDLCRSIHMRFEKDVEVKGIPAYRFTPPRDVLASGKNNPENEGFCLMPKNCLDDGVLDVSVCRKGAPVVVSFPHFHMGDKKYADAIDGISPVHAHHQTFLDLNPTMGVPVRAMKRAQINIHLDRISGFPLTRNLNNTIFPIIFLNESVVIDDVSAARIQKLLLIVKLVSYFPLILITLGVILLFITIILIVRYCQNKMSAKKDTMYTPVSAKSDEQDEKNGTFIGLTPVDVQKC
ncbi:lysosome membrane protein 2-like isoform X2 [Myxocyprinus asiaticus]|uniref:lysosome membrane protein 2-like isoform X2 n=1 Tax=Myxocyprinus asiaticus TaxID=70543 RepID=UPI00222297EB|nr:lysosome membrane protein 2-like isoform X2 [Myxocyprinus asiaticus]